MNLEGINFLHVSSVTKGSRMRLVEVVKVGSDIHSYHIYYRYNKRYMILQLNYAYGSDFKNVYYNGAMWA